jgi:hypothetical protein
MILFVTAYDPSTRTNLGVATRLTGTRVRLIESDATRADLWNALARHPDVPLMAMSHGRRSFLRAQGGRDPHAIEVRDAITLGTRSVFAWACLTSAELGRAAAAAGTVWFGFPVRIAAPPDDGQLQALLAQVLQLAVNGLPRVNDELSCRALLDDLVEAAREALETVDAIPHDSSAQQCFEQFQLRLEAWLPGHDDPIRPKTAPRQRHDDLDPREDLGA